MMEYDTPPLEQIYNNATSPYFRAPHVYLGLAARIVFDRPVITRNQALAVGVVPTHAVDSSEPVIFTSRGGLRYDRTHLEAFIRNGIGPENWTSQAIFVRSISCRPVRRKCLSTSTRTTASRPATWSAYRLETDRLASVNAPLSGGEFLTKPLTFTGRNLLINLSTSWRGESGWRLRMRPARPFRAWPWPIRLRRSAMTLSARWRGRAGPISAD